MTLIDFREAAKQSPRRILLCEPDERIVRAAITLKHENLAVPVLVGDAEAFVKHGDITGIDVVAVDAERYADRYHELRKHKNLTREDALSTLKDPAFFSTMLLLDGQADGLVCGATWPTANTLRPALQLLRDGLVSSYFIMRTSKGDMVFADCALNVQPTADELSDIAIGAATEAEALGIPVKVALLSHSTEGSAHNGDQEKVMHAADAARKKAQALGKGWPIGGEMQVDAALDLAVGKSKAPHSQVQGDATVLVFPDLDAGNIGYKLVQRFSGAEAIGPFLTNLRKPVNDLSRGCTAGEIVDVCCITAWQSLRNA